LTLVPRELGASDEIIRWPVQNKQNKGSSLHPALLERATNCHRMLQCQKLLWVQKAITQIHGSKNPSRAIKFKDTTSVSGKSLSHSLLEFGTACQGTITACLPLSSAVPQASAVVYV